MKQYLDLLKAIKENGTQKSAARANMPGSLSLFGYQFRHNLADGFPLLTTKKISFKNIVVELLWFLRGDTNIKYLIDNGLNIWNEDSYNYYCTQCKKADMFKEDILSFEKFIDTIVNNLKYEAPFSNYTIGDCGYQYGKVWRKWQGKISFDRDHEIQMSMPIVEEIDQIKKIINGLKNNPESRRHILTSIDPAHDEDLALYWCHCLAQFNCRPIPERIVGEMVLKMISDNKFTIDEIIDKRLVPIYYLDCQLYQRSADVFLGVPYNIASYALLTEIFAKICNMIPGEFIHTFGDVHIYDNHIDQVNEQLIREPKTLPTLKLSGVDWSKNSFDIILKDIEFNGINECFILKNYDPHPAIKAKLSTGMIK